MHRMFTILHFASAQLHANVQELACKYLTARQLTSLPFLRVVACFCKTVHKVCDVTSNLLATLLGSSGWDALEKTGRTVNHQHAQFISFNVLVYADDFVLLDPSWLGLQRLLDVLLVQFSLINILQHQLFYAKKRNCTYGTVFPRFRFDVSNLQFLSGLLMRPEHSETKTETETRECKTEIEIETEIKKICHETETKNYETETETSPVKSITCESNTNRMFYFFYYTHEVND